MRVLPFVLVVPALIVTSPAVAAKKDVLSWGKAGVSFEDYRSDAAACGRQGYNLDISGTEQVEVLKRASQRLEANEAALGTYGIMIDMYHVSAIAHDSAKIVEAARPEKRIKELRQMMEQTVSTCLVQHGYKQFRLTDAQRDQLKRLKKGTAERNVYLHSLARDPQVLNGQAA